MKIYGPKLNPDGSVDVMIDHPVYGLVPFTASPDDSVEYGKDIHDALIRGEYGEITPAPAQAEPSDEELRAAERERIRNDYNNFPPATLEGRLDAIEKILGLREVEITRGGRT